MKRTLQHKINSAAQKQFEQIIPDEWAIRNQKENDYGIDYEIEVFNNDLSTGIIFKIQLKGTKNLKILKNNNLSFSIDIDHIKYFIEELNIPTFFIIADIVNNKTYWNNILLDRDLRNSYHKTKINGNKSVTMHIPLNNLLPKDTQLLSLEYGKCMNYLSARYLSDKNNIQFSDIVEHVDFKDGDIINFQNKVDILKIEKISKCINKNDFTTARKYIASLLNSNETNIPTKFQSLLFDEKIELINQTNKQKLSVKDLGIISQPYISKMKELTKYGPKHLKLFSLSLVTTNRLLILSQDEFNLFLNKKINTEDSDVYWLSELYLLRIKLNKEIQTLYRQLNRFINIAFSKEYYSIIPKIVDKFSEAVTIFLVRLKEEELTDISEFYNNDITRNIKNSILISYNYKDTEDIVSLCSRLFIISISQKDDDDNKFEQSHGLITQILDEIITDKEYCLLIKSMVKTSLQLFKDIYSKPPNQVDFTIEEEKEVYIRMAESLGINLNDNNDGISKIINIGIKDLNPERVLKNCLHFYVKLMGGGLPAQWLKLPSAGSKALICTKHGHTICGITLDGLFNLLNNKYCAKCNDCLPHDTKWKWTRQWQQEQDKLYFKKLA